MTNRLDSILILAKKLVDKDEFCNYSMPAKRLIELIDALNAAREALASCDEDYVCRNDDEYRILTYDVRLVKDALKKINELGK